MNIPHLSGGRGFAAVSVLASCALAACGGGGSDAPTTRNVSFALTDAPTCGYDKIFVTVKQVRVNRDESADPANPTGWSDLTLATPLRVDLLDLQNGLLAELGTMPLVTGNYRQLRLVLADNTSAAPLANSVIPTGGSEVPLKTPSGQQSGVKINTNFDVSATQVADLKLVLDMDGCKSVVMAGNSGQYLLKPVVTAIPVFGAAGNAIQGFVNPALAGATVTAQVAGVPAKTTVAQLQTDGSVKFVLSPVPVGSYDVVLTAPGYSSAVITGVPVIDTARTTLASTATPLALAASSVSRSASGKATTANNPALIPPATLRVIQKFSGGPNVELGFQSVDPTTGTYSFTLPVAAPGKAPYAAGALGYAFAPDAAAAARYTLEASVPGKDKQVADVDLTTTDAVANFEFAP